MHIAEDKVVTLNYTLKDDDGNIIDESRDGSFIYLHGAQNIIPGLENALLGKASGESLTVAVAPEDAYGVRDETRIEKVPREMFPEDTEITSGMQFHAQSQEGHSITVVVLSADGDTVTIDGNHPLAGVSLNFDVEIIEIRDASQEEKDHGHVHSGGEHNH